MTRRRAVWLGLALTPAIAAATWGALDTTTRHYRKAHPMTNHMDRLRTGL